MALYPRNGQAIGSATTVYNTKITAPTSASLEINLPSNNGTLALLTDIPDVPDVGELSTTSSISLTPDVDETLTNHIELHRISKTGDYNDLLNQPNILQVIPNVGVLSSTATTALIPTTDESLTGRVELHKISKTGSYNDLVGTPSIGSGEITVSMGGSTVGSFNVNQSSASTVNVPVVKIPRKEIYNVIYSQEFTKRKSDSGSFGSGTYYFAQMIPVDIYQNSYLRLRLSIGQTCSIIAEIVVGYANSCYISLIKDSHLFTGGSQFNVSVLSRVDTTVISNRGFQVGFIGAGDLSVNVEILEEYNCDIIWVSEAEGETDLSIAYEKESLSYASDFPSSNSVEHVAPTTIYGGSARLGSVAEGTSDTYATGFVTHAEGYYTTASGYASHSEGGYSASSFTQGNLASGDNSHAGGLISTASGVDSFTHGLGLSSTGESHASFGTYNQVGDYATSDPFIFTVGNGTANNARSNAMAVAKSGCVVIGGPELVLTGPDGSTVTIKYDHINKTVTYVYSQ